MCSTLCTLPFFWQHYFTILLCSSSLLRLHRPGSQIPAGFVAVVRGPQARAHRMTSERQQSFWRSTSNSSQARIGRIQVCSPGGDQFLSCQKYAGQLSPLAVSMYGYNHAFMQYLAEQQVRPHQATQRLDRQHHQNQQQQFPSSQRLKEWSEVGKHFGQQHQPRHFQQHGTILTSQQQHQLHHQIQQQRQLVHQHNLFTRHYNLSHRQSLGGSTNYCGPCIPSHHPYPHMVPPAEDSSHKRYQPINHAVREHIGDVGHVSQLSGPTPPPTPSPGFHQTPSQTPLMPTTNNRIVELLSPPLSSPETPPHASTNKSPFRYSADTPKAKSLQEGKRQMANLPPSPPSNQLLKLSQVSLPLAGQSAKKRRAELKRLGLPYHSDDDEEEEEELMRVKRSKVSERRSMERNPLVRMEVPLLDQGSVAQLCFRSDSFLYSDPQ